MAGFVKVKTVKNYLAIANYTPTEKGHLRLLVGDLFEPSLENNDWFYGKNLLQSNGEKGIVPKSFLQEKNYHSERIPYMFIEPSYDLLFTEIKMTLRDWHEIILEFFKNDEKSKFNKFLLLFNKLHEYFKFLQSTKLSLDEIKMFEKNAVDCINEGQMLINGDFIIRDENFEIIRSNEVDCIKLLQHHEDLQKSYGEKNKDLPSSISNIQFALFVQLQSIVCSIQETVEISFYLYKSNENVQISESFKFEWCPQMYNNLDNFSFLLVDLNSRMTTDENIYLVVCLVKSGFFGKGTEADSKIRKVIGVGAMKFSDFFNSDLTLAESKNLFISFTYGSEKDFIENQISRNTKAAKNDVKYNDKGIWFSMKIYHGDYIDIIHDYPFFEIEDVPISRKIGFPDVILPNDMRNEIYIRIVSGEFQKAGISERNIEVLATVVNDEMVELKNVIFPASGSNPLKTYSTVVYYHEEQPKWNETFKISLSIQEFEKCHLLLVFKHCSSNENKSKFFGFSFLKFMNKNSTTINDGVYDLIVYRYEKINLPYTIWPSTRKEEQKMFGETLTRKFMSSMSGATKEKENLKLCVTVCSTKLTQDENIMKLLTWKENKILLSTVLKDVLRVEGGQIVKFLQDILDSIFEILMTPEEEQKRTDTVTCLVHILSQIVTDRNLHSFRTVLSQYFAESFSAPAVFNILIVMMTTYIEISMSDSYNKISVSSIKSWEYLMKAIQYSKNIYTTMIDEKTELIKFNHYFKTFLDKIALLLKNESLLLINVSVAKYLPDCFDVIIEIYDIDSFIPILGLYIRCMSFKVLKPQKIQFIHQIMESKFFFCKKSLDELLPICMSTTRQYLDEDAELHLCIKVFTTLNENENLLSKNRVEAISKEIFRSLVQVIIRCPRNSENFKSFVAILATFLQRISGKIFSALVDSYDNIYDLLDFLTELIMILKELSSTDFFPLTWIQMFLELSRSSQSILCCLAEVLCEKLKNNWNKDLSEHYFECSIILLTQPCLQIEEFSESKKRRLLSMNGDLRLNIAIGICNMWYNLGDKKVHFVPKLIPLFLKASFVKSEATRHRIISIFYDMMTTVCIMWAHDETSISSKIFMIEQELIETFDKHIEKNVIDSDYGNLFVKILREKNNSNLQSNVIDKLISNVANLLKLIAEYKEVKCGYYIDDFSTYILLKIMDYHLSLNRTDLYVKYIDQLYKQFIDASDYMIASFVALKYINLLEYSNKKVDKKIRSTIWQKPNIQKDLIIEIYYEILSNYEKGNHWIKSAEICSILTDIYTKSMKLEFLSKLKLRESENYKYIMEETVPISEYYYVAFYGAKFSYSFRNNEFIFRGKNYEKIKEFVDRITNLMPDPIILQGSVNPKDYEDKDGFYINVFSVQPVPKDEMINSEASLCIKYYYYNNENIKFQQSKTIKGKDKSLASISTIRTEYMCENELPYISDWSMIIGKSETTIHPIVIAKETILTVNNSFKLLLATILETEENPNITELSMKINGVVDAGVNGGYLNYKVFFEESYQNNLDSMEIELLDEFKDSIKDQLDLLGKSLTTHSKYVVASMHPLHNHMVNCFYKLVEMVKTEFKIEVDKYSIPAPRKTSFTKREKRHSQLY